MSGDESFREEEVELPTVEQIEAAINMLPWWKKIILIILSNIGVRCMMIVSDLINEKLEKVRKCGNKDQV